MPEQAHDNLETTDQLAAKEQLGIDPRAKRYVIEGGVVAFMTQDEYNEYQEQMKHNP